MASNNSICSCNVKNNLRSMIGYRYDSDHDFYEQLKKAIGYTGATYDGVCERLIELMDDRALELKTEALGEAHKRTMEALATAEARVAELEREGANAKKQIERQCKIFTKRKVAWSDQQTDYERAFLARNARIDELETELRDAQKVSAERDEAADWVEEHGGIVELDKRLMPPGVEWPRFEDGAKVQYGDIYIFNGHACPIDTIRIENNGAFSIEAGKRIAYFARNGTVKRPEPEVFGADGVPIKVGETVYEVYDGGSAEVVKSITYVNNFCKINYESDGWGRPNVLIHTSPDTQERINDDIDECSLDDWLDAHPDGDPSTMIHHYCARQRELDARTMGCE